MKITLTQGKTAYIDDSDYTCVSRYSWQYDKQTGYARTTIWYNNKHSKTLLLHRLILDITDTQTKVDHIDGNTLNNCRNNLRIASSQQNSWNAKIKQHSSKYKGVCWHKGSKRWEAQICKDYVKLRLGYFNSELEAAKAYNAKAIELFGEFARVNEICE